MIDDVVVNLGAKGDVNVDILDDDAADVAAGAFKKTRAGGN